MKYLKKICKCTVSTVIIAVLLLYFCINTTYGSKFTVYSLYKIYAHRILNNTEIIYPKINGTLLQGLYFENFQLLSPQFGLNLCIQHANFKLNLMDFFLHKIIKVSLTNLTGTFNQQPLTAEISLILEQQQLLLDYKNFIKIGDNTLILDPATIDHDGMINFNLDLNQLEIFNPNLSGSIKIHGTLSKKLNLLTAKIIPKHLKFNDFAIYKLINPQNTDLAITIKLVNNIPKLILNLELREISGLMDFIPGITRLKGRLDGKLELDLDKPLTSMHPNLMLHDLSVTLPAYGIKIKPMQIKIKHNAEKFFHIDGSGVIRNGIGGFKLTGKFNPFIPDFPNELNIYSDHMEFIHNHEFHLIGNTDLKLVLLWLDQQLKITGNTTITAGTINLNTNSSKITKSKDVVLINPIATKSSYTAIAKQHFKFLPDINLRIEENTRLFNKHLDANISGKIRLYSLDDYDNTLLGEGRLTIKHGVYTLSGQKFNIEKGRIIYLPGTLIGHPLLDIKILSNLEKIKPSLHENYLYIEGTLDDPIIKDSGLVNENLVMLHLLNLGNSTFGHKIKQKIKLEEFEIQENDNMQLPELNNLTENKSFLDNKNLVISKKIFAKWYVKYLKPLNTHNNALKIERKINNNLAIEIGSNSEEGYGVDLRFFKETK